jgi:alpha-1,6-mannosyltransferase
MNPQKKNPNYWLIAISTSMILCYLFLFYFVNSRQDIFEIFTSLLLLFLGYFVLIHQSLKNTFSNHIVFKFIFALRILPILSIPLLSDDFYRFVWDGQLLVHHLNPFAHLPSEIIKSNFKWVDSFLYQRMNSPAYYSVYPPFNQFIFWLSALAGKGNLLYSVIILRLSIIAFDFGNLFLIKKILRLKNLNPNLLFIYALNPLVIIEFAWNLHFEAAMIFFTLLSLWFFLNNKKYYSAFSLALAICTKILPLIFIPLLLKQIGWVKTLKYSLVVALIAIVLFYPFINSIQLLRNLLMSLKLYYGTFEFNGGFHQLFKYFGWKYLGYNPIFYVSKILIILTIIGFTIIYSKSKNIFEGIFLLLFVYSAFSAIVHPWYILPMVAFTPFIKLRFALVWSALIGLSYYTYREIPYKENTTLVIIEYVLLLGFIIYELKYNKEVIE